MMMLLWVREAASCTGSGEIHQEQRLDTAMDTAMSTGVPLDWQRPVKTLMSLQCWPFCRAWCKLA